MKSLLDIQQDVRKLEKSIQEISDKVKSISLDIENMRNSPKETVFDFSKIEMLAQKIEFKKHPLNQLKQERACKGYLEMLLNIVRLDPDKETVSDRMVFIQWLQMQSNIDWSLEDLYMDCLKIDKASYYELVDLIPEKYKEQFLVDAMIAANISGNPNEEIYEYIADIVAILGFSSEEVKDLAVISRVALSQNIEGLKREHLRIIPDKAKEYVHYIKSSIVKESLKSFGVIRIMK